MTLPLALNIEDLFQYLPVIVIFVLMVLGSLLGNKQKQRPSDAEPGEARRSGGGQSWEEMLEEMLGGKTRTPPEPQRPEPPPVERPTARRQPPPSRQGSPPPVPKRRPQKQRRPQPVPQDEIITATATLPPMPKAESPAASQPFEAGNASAARMNINASEIGAGSDAYAGRQRPTSDSAARLRAWLTPSTLRRDFVLTELFRPPVGLRDDHRP